MPFAALPPDWVPAKSRPRHQRTPYARDENSPWAADFLLRHRVRFPRSGAIRRIHTIRTMHLGPQDVLATVCIDFEDTVSAARVESIVADLEVAIKTRFPEIRHLFLATKGD